LVGGVTAGQLLAYVGITYLAVAAGQGDQVLDVLLDHRVAAGRGPAAALVFQGGHGHAPALVETADDVVDRSPDVVEEGRRELIVTGDRADGPELQPALVVGDVDDHVRDAAVTGLGAGVG